MLICSTKYLVDLFYLLIAHTNKDKTHCSHSFIYHRKMVPFLPDPLAYTLLPHPFSSEPTDDFRSPIPITYQYGTRWRSYRYYSQGLIAGAIQWDYSMSSTGGVYQWGLLNYSMGEGSEVSFWFKFFEMNFTMFHTDRQDARMDSRINAIA